MIFNNSHNIWSDSSYKWFNQKSYIFYKSHEWSDNRNEWSNNTFS